MSAAKTLPDGWMGKTSRAWLAQQASSHSRIVEVGVWKGRSTMVLAAATPGTVWAVDHWQGTPADPAQHGLYRADVDVDQGETVYRGFLKALRRQIHAGKVVPVRKASLEAAAWMLEVLGPSMDMVFLDADHSYEGAAADIEAWRPLLVEGGLLCGHDYSDNWPGVKQAVDEAFGDRVTVGPRSLWSIVLP